MLPVLSYPLVRHVRVAPTCPVSWQVSLNLKAALALNADKPPVQNPEDLLPHSSLNEFANTVLDATSIEAVNDMKVKWKTWFQCARQLKIGLDKSNHDVNSHVTLIEKNKQKLADREAKNKLKEQSREQQAQAKVKMEKVTQKETKDEPIYKVSMDVLPQIAVFQDAQGDDLWGFPWVSRRCEVVEAWAQTEAVAKQFPVFGGIYKKGADYIESGRSSALMPASTKEECNALWKDYIPNNVMDISDIAGGPSFMANSFLYGFAPDMKWVGFTPSSSAIVRVLTMGQVPLAG